MNPHVDRKTPQLNAESRRLWTDHRVWVVNCLAVESEWMTVPAEERETARRGCELMLAALIERW